jgi:glycosyltransferase involved in cell wall biosynthesis
MILSMKVGFNTRLLVSPTLRGWNRYTINLLAELPALGVQLFLYSDQPLHPSHLARLPKDSYQVRIAPPMRYVLWEQYWLPKQCEKDRVDILHCPQNFGLPWSSPCPRVLTLHDAIDQVYYSQHITWQQWNFANIQNQMYHWIARTRADRIITVSEYSKGDLVKYLHIPEHKIMVIYEAADARFHEPVSDNERLHIRTLYKLNSPYIFYVGGWEKRKNIPFLIRSFAQANLDGVDLVLAGGQDEQRAALVQLAESLGVSDHLKLLGWVDDTDLPALYAEALCFVYPSEYEGFGLQLCEAMAVGCPVLAARTTCLPEVLGNGGKTFGLDKSSELQELLVRLVTDAAFQENLKNCARQMARFYSWKRTAIATETLYGSLSVYSSNHVS